MPSAVTHELPLPVPEPLRRRLSAGERLLLAAALVLPWLLAGAMPLIPPDEGRYASVSLRMVESGRWLVPEFEGRAHLTKPPLTYWLQALSIEALGANEWAVRLPSVLATSLAVLVTFGLGRRMFGTRPALAAAAMMPLMPLVAVIGRIANADALFALAWLAALGFGWRAIEGGRRRHGIAFWVAIAAGTLVKSVAAFGPLVILVAWAIAGGRAGELRRLRPLPWALLAGVPLAAWIGLVHRVEPGVVEVAWQQTVGRAVGAEGIWPKPWWFYLPVYLVGLFPASAMLTLPWFNQSWSASLRTFRGGDARALCLMATAVPLVGFSLASGKLPTYLLPLAAPSALLAGVTLERWMRGQFDVAIPGFRPPDVRITLAVVAGVVGLGGMIAAIAVHSHAPTLWIDAIPVLVTPTIIVVVAIAWSRGARRDHSLLGLWIAGVASLAMATALLVRHAGPMTSRDMLAELRDRLGEERPTIVLIGVSEPCIPFYNHGLPTVRVNSLAEMVAEGVPPGAIIFAPDEPVEEHALAWTAVASREPELAGNTQPLGRWVRWFAKPTRILLWTPPATPIRARGADPQGTAAP
jgi:4-amino-4-deoxy-L-arabinose transferase-like glycosyltransferase